MKTFLVSAVLTLSLTTLLFSYFTERQMKGHALLHGFPGLVILHEISLLFGHLVLQADYQFLIMINPFGLLYGPVIFLLGTVPLSLGDFLKKAALHFIPFGIFLILYSVLIFNPPAENHFSHRLYLIWHAAIILSWIIYPLIILRFLRRENNKERDLRALIRNLSRVFLLSAVIFSGVIVMYEYPDFDPDGIAFRRFELFQAVLLVSVGLIYLFLTRQDSDQPVYTSVHPADYFSSRIVDVISPKIMQMEVPVPRTAEKTISSLDPIQEKIDFLRTDSGIQEHAERLGISPAELSTKIKTETGLTFNQYLNSKRVEYARELLNRNPHETMEDLVRKSGFGSTASFYRNFKKFSGMSPGDYVAQTQKSR